MVLTRLPTLIHSPSRRRHRRPASSGTIAYSSVNTETNALGSDTNGDYDFTKTSLSIRSWEETGTILSGAFTRTGTGEDDSTATEYNYYTAGSADFTEIITEEFAYTTTGNRVTGAITDEVTDGARETTLAAHTSDTGSGWDYTVTQSTIGTFWRYNESYSDGTYENTEGTSDGYTVTQGPRIKSSTFSAGDDLANALREVLDRCSAYAGFFS